MADSVPQRPKERLHFTVTPQNAGHRLDAVIAAETNRLSRNRFKALIKQGHVSINHAVVKEPNTRVNPGTEIIVELPPAEDPVPKAEDIPLCILYEDARLIVIDKPAGLVVHPGPGNWTGTLVNALIHHCGKSLSGIGGVKRPGIVHRLDKDTSGVLVIAKTDQAHLGLSRQFADHGRTNRLERLYQALVWGAIEPQKGAVSTPIGRADHNRIKMAAIKLKADGTHRGKQALTHYQTLRRFADREGNIIASLLQCRLETGRTHQIRVHMAHLGHPLIGDDIYGAGFKTKANLLPEETAKAVRRFRRQALFAASLQFEHPISGELMHFEAKPPEDFKKLVTTFDQV